MRKKQNRSINYILIQKYRDSNLKSLDFNIIFFLYQPDT